jgi:hypothetical protein
VALFKFNRPKPSLTLYHPLLTGNWGHRIE